MKKFLRMIQALAACSVLAIGVASAAEIPLGDLPGRIAELPRGGPVTVLCKSGARASLAASLLDGAGCEVRLVGRGCAPELTRAG